MKAQINLTQKLSLQQKLSPQQIQYIKLLQLPTMALEQRIKAEIEANPLLEEGDELEELSEESEDSTEERDEQDSAEADEQAVSVDTEAKTAEEGEQEWDWDEYLNSAEDLYGYKARVDQSDDDEDRRELPTPYRQSMAEHLLDQLTFLALDETQQIIAEQIIGSIDEDGYLRRPLESIVDDIMFNYGASLDEADVEAVLKRIQRLDPIGMGARDLRECLLAQLEAMPEHTPGQADAIRMLRDAYKAFTMKHFDHIMRRLEIGDEELKEAFDLIHRLDPKPGEGDFTAGQNYVVPDFIVEYVDGEYIISLTNGNAPELRISRGYMSMLNQLSTEKKSGEKKRADNINTETRQFLKNKLESAKWFINSIHQRRHTMLKVMHAIVELQKEFFRSGEGNLRPMILKDVAEIIDMDISTVSRVVNGKYVQTEFGVYELKYFFSEGLTTDSGEEVSNKEVKALIQEIIESEDKGKPLSDQRIAKMLEAKGFNIARRTVTKYREQLGIPVARLRKEIVLA